MKTQLQLNKYYYYYYYYNLGGGAVSLEEDPVLDNVVNVFVCVGSFIICLLHKFTLSNQAQVSLLLPVSLPDLV